MSCATKDGAQVDPQPAVVAGTGLAELPEAVRQGDAVAAANATARGIVGLLAVVEPSLPDLEAGGKLRAGTCACDEGSCEFASCDIGEAMLSGGLTAAGESFALDVDLSLATEGGSLSVHCEGSLAITEAAISGSLSCEGEQADGSPIEVNASFDVSVEDGCPAEGEIEISARLGSVSLETEVEFDGECGEASVDDDDSDSDTESDSVSDSVSESDDSDSDSESDLEGDGAADSASDSDDDDSESLSESASESVDGEDDDTDGGGDDESLSASESVSDSASDDEDDDEDNSGPGGGDDTDGGI